MVRELTSAAPHALLALCSAELAGSGGRPSGMLSGFPFRHTHGTFLPSEMWCATAGDRVPWDRDRSGDRPGHRGPAWGAVYGPSVRSIKVRPSCSLSEEEEPEVPMDGHRVLLLRQ